MRSCKVSLQLTPAYTKHAVLWHTPVRSSAPVQPHPVSLKWCASSWPYHAGVHGGVPQERSASPTTRNPRSVSASVLRHFDTCQSHCCNTAGHTLSGWPQPRGRCNDARVKSCKGLELTFISELRCSQGLGQGSIKPTFIVASIPFLDWRAREDPV